MKTRLIKAFISLLLVTSACSQPSAVGDQSASNASSKQRTTDSQHGKKATMKIRLVTKTRMLTATLLDNETARDFVSLLPLTLTMNDLFRREKFAHLPRAISEKGQRAFTYHVGELIYWSPGPDVAVYYKQDGKAIPDPGIIVIGKIDSDVEVFDMPGSLTVEIELAAPDK